MRIISIEDTVNHDLYFKNIIALSQTWKFDKMYSYISGPRPDSGLLMMLTDTAEFICVNGKRLTPSYGDLVYIPEGVYYYVKFNEDNSEEDPRTALINFTVLDQKGDKVFFADEITVIAKESEKVLLETFLELSDIYKSKTKNQLILKSKLYYVINKLAVENNKNQSVLYPAINFINNNLVQEFKVSELAAMCAMSESTFRREFKRKTGVTPVKYVTVEKLKKAGQMLKQTTLTVNEICNELEFYDNAYFCKVFKRYFKLSPTEYRNEFFDNYKEKV